MTNRFSMVPPRFFAASMAGDSRLAGDRLNAPIFHYLSVTRWLLPS